MNKETKPSKGIESKVYDGFCSFREYNQCISQDNCQYKGEPISSKNNKVYYRCLKNTKIFIHIVLEDPRNIQNEKTN